MFPGSLIGNIPAQESCAILVVIEYHQLMYKVNENLMGSCIRESYCAIISRVAAKIKRDMEGCRDFQILLVFEECKALVRRYV